MTYMSGLSGEVALDCFPYEGAGGDINFEDNELVFFLGKEEISGISAASIGFSEYYFIPNSPFACVSNFDKEENVLYLVEARYSSLISGVVSGPMTIINRCFISGDIVVGSTSGAVRKVGKKFNYFDGKLRCSLSELGYNKNKHDLLNFDAQGVYDEQSPFNLNFYEDSFFNNLDHKFSCVPLCNRFPLPVPYTASKYGFRLCCAVTRKHIVIAEHVQRYMTNGGEFKFYDPENNSVISRRVLYYKQVGTILSELSYDSFGGDVSIGILDEELPDSVYLACIPSIAQLEKIPTFSTVKGMLLSSDMRGYSINYMNNDRSNNIICLGNINQANYISNTEDIGSCFLSGGTGDSNSLCFLKNNNDLLFCGCVSAFGNSSSGGLSGEFENLNKPYISNFIFDFEYYPDSLGNIIKSPVNRYKFFSYTSSLRFWLSLENDICNEIFSSRLVWGSDTNSSIIPNRKTLSEFETINASHGRDIDLNKYNKNKIKYIS